MVEWVRVSVLLAAVLVAAVEAERQTYGHYYGRVGIDRNLVACFDMNGIQGTIQFYQPRPSAPVTIHVNLEGLDQYAEHYPWHIHQFPAVLALFPSFPCSNRILGGHYDPLGAAAGFSEAEYNARCAANPDDCEIGDLSGKLGRLTNDKPWQQFVDTRLDLFGPKSPAGRSIVIHRQDGARWACANIEYDGVRVITRRYVFNSPIFQGQVLLRRSEGRAETTIDAQLFRIDGGPVPTFNHSWSLRVGQPEDGNCSTVGDVFGSTFDEEEAYIRDVCDRCNHRVCILGDLTTKCGPLNVEMVGDKARIRAFCTDAQLGLIPYSYLTDPPLTLVIQDANFSDTILACSIGETIDQACARATFRTRHIFGDFLWYQSSGRDCTYLQSHLTGLNSVITERAFLEIRTNPVPPNGSCDTLGPIFDRPDRISYSDAISSGAGVTGDILAIGDLRGKLGVFDDEGSRDIIKSCYMPLGGPYRIIGHSLVLIDSATNDPIACSNITSVHQTPDFESFLDAAFARRNN